MSCGAAPRWPWPKRAVDPGSFLRQAKDDARSLEREGQPWALAHAHYLKAGIAACEGDSVRAIRELTLAVEDYDQAEMPLRAQILRLPAGRDPERRRDARAPRQGRAVDQGPGHRLARPLGRDVCPGVLENLDRVDRDKLLTGLASAKVRLNE